MPGFVIVNLDEAEGEVPGDPGGDAAAGAWAHLRGTEVEGRNLKLKANLESILSYL